MLSQINIASNKTGLKFSTIQYNLNNPVPIDNISQIYTDSIITDSINWSKISGSFVADSNYKYVSFGNFFTDSQTSTISFDSSAYFAHYFIDDIRISTDSIYVNGVKNTETLIVCSVSPNPAKEKIKISAAQIKSIFFNDILGNALYKSNLNFVSSTEIDVSLFPNGIYLLKIETINFSQTIKLIVQK